MGYDIIPLRSVEIMGSTLPNTAIVGAGTFLSADDESRFADCAKVNVSIFSLGSSFYGPGFSAAETGKRAESADSAWDGVIAVP